MTILLIIIAISLLILVHEAGHFFAAKLTGVKVDEFGIGFPPRLIRIKGKETTYSINALPFGGFVKLAGEFEEAKPQSRERGSFASKLNPAPGFLSQPAWKKTVTLLAGVIMNMLFAWVLFAVVFSHGIPSYVVISQADAGSPAATAGLRQGDIIMNAQKGDVVLGKPVSLDDFLNLVKTNPTEPVTLTLERDGREFDVTLAGRTSPPAGQGALGVELVDIGVKGMGFIRGVGQALATTGETFAAVAAGLWHIIVQAFAGKEALSEVSGPIGVFVIARSVGTLGLLYLIQLFAIISVNLAVLNLIPFPALDGGRLLFVGIEKLKGKPLSSKVQVWFNTAGFAVLILLMLMVTFKDLKQFVF